MISNTEPRDGFRLWFHLAVMLCVALLPIAVVAFLQTNALRHDVLKRNQESLLGATLRAAEPETALVGRASGILAMLAKAVPGIRNDDAACVTLMRDAQSLELSASLVGYIPVDAIMRCSTTGVPHDLNDRPTTKRLLAARVPQFVVIKQAVISGTSVLGLSHPVFDRDGRYLGYVWMSIPHRILSTMEQEDSIVGSGELKLHTFWTFDREGDVLTANRSLDDAAQYLPGSVNLRDQIGSRGKTFTDTNKNGDLMTFVVVPVVNQEIYLISAWETVKVSAFDRFAGRAFIAPAMLLLAGLIVASLAAENLVARHVRVLTGSIRQFSNGDRRLQSPSLTGAPHELKVLASGYRDMTESIVRNEALLEDEVHQKEVLLREVHHRVKNNLQLISSIMNLQLRRTQNPETRDVLKSLQDRVLSLATIHRGLYQTSGMADVSARELLRDIIGQILSLSTSGDNPFEVQTEIADLRLVPDQAVPLSLLLTEAVTNAIKYAGATPANPGKIRITLSREGGSDALLEVWNSIAPLRNAAASPPPGGGLGSQLFDAFVRQLGAQSSFAVEATSYLVAVRFRVSPLSDAENKLDPDETNTVTNGTDTRL